MYIVVNIYYIRKILSNQIKCIITTTQMNSVVDKLSEKKPTKNKSQTKTKQGRKDLQEHRETDQLIVTEWAACC